MKRILIFCVFFILLIGFVSGKNITITAAEGNGKDKYCLGNCTNSDELVFTDNETNRVYIMFDLTSLPDNTVVVSAYLLFKFKENSSMISDFAKVYPVNGGWQEDDDQQPGYDALIGTLNDINCRELCNNEEDWIGVEGYGLVYIINSMLTGSNNGFIIKDSKDSFKVYSSEAELNQPFLYLEYEADCVDLDSDGFKFGDCIISDDCNDSNYYINPNATEICNYMDDDCNGTIDDTGYECKICNESNGYLCNSSEYCREEFLDVLDSDVCCPVECRPTCVEGTTVTCGNDTGECVSGYSVCHKNEWSDCLDEVPPVKELCNMKDDNCDGIIDNTDNYLLCGCSNESSPSMEIYDRIDNDCDNIIDENTTCLSRGGNSCAQDEACPGIILNGTEVTVCCSLPCSRDCVAGESKSCGISIGACKEGTIECVNGKWGECIGSIGPVSETCNSIDDDCDGVIDNLEDKNSCQCYNDKKPFEELCNLIDDDCDGTIDEDCTFVSDACSDGILNFNENSTDCGGSCKECEIEIIEDDSLSTDKPSEPDGILIDDIPETKTSGTATTKSSSVSSKLKIFISILILIAVGVLILVVYVVFFQPPKKPGFTQSKQDKSPFKRDNFFIPKKKPVFIKPQKKVDRYDAILGMKPHTSKSAKDIKGKIEEKF